MACAKPIQFSIEVCTPNECAFWWECAAHGNTFFILIYFAHAFPLLLITWCFSSCSLSQCSGVRVAQMCTDKMTVTKLNRILSDRTRRNMFVCTKMREVSLCWALQCSLGAMIMFACRRPKRKTPCVCMSLTCEAVLSRSFLFLSRSLRTYLFQPKWQCDAMYKIHIESEFLFGV